MQQQLGHYQVKDLLGEGSFASVYRAFDEKFERYVALKILKPVWLSDPEAVGRFKREAKTMAQLRHPHIVDVYDVGESEGNIYLAQLLVEGETLADHLERGGALAWTGMLEVLRAVAAALDYAHGQGMVHRDVKPSNILLSQDGRAYLGDFGLVRAAEGSVVLSTSSGGMIGTPAYMAPEQWEGKGATAVTDVYALSCVVVEMLTGQVLFDGTTPATVMRQHLLEGPKFPATWPADIPEQVSGVLRQGLAETPTERISSAGELFKALEALSTLPAVEEEDKVSTLTSPLTAEKVPPLWLISSAGQRYKLTPGSLTLGRSATCDIHFDDRLASRHHATLKFDGQRCIVYDENSANGTFINGKPVQSGGQPFEVGDRLRIGDTQFALRTAAPATSDVVKKKPKSAVKPSPPPAPKRRSSSGLTAALVGCGVLLALIVCLGGGYAVSVNPSLLAFIITPTSTSTSTSTPTPTPESSSTYTPTPTDTPTVTLTATSTPAATPDQTATAAARIAIEQTATADQVTKEIATAQAAGTQTAIAATQTAIAATQTAQAAATQTAIAATQTAQAAATLTAEAEIDDPPVTLVPPDKTTITINEGECTYLRWQIQNVSAVYLNNSPVKNEGSQQVCPTTTTTYRWLIVKLNNRQVEQAVTITVIPKPPTPVLLTTHSPALAAFKNKLFLAFRTSNNEIWIANYDGTEWEVHGAILGIVSDQGPALATFNNRLYVTAAFITHGDEDPAWLTSSADGSTWYHERKSLTERTPALAVFNNRLYQVTKGHNNPTIWVTSGSADGTWKGHYGISEVKTTYGSVEAKTKYGPALAAFNNHLYLAARDYDNNSVWLARSTDGSKLSWKDYHQIPGVETSHGPALAVFNNRLYLVTKDHDDEFVWVTRSTNGLIWLGGYTVSGVETSDNPALAVFNDRLYLAFKGHKDNYIYLTSTADGSKWTGPEQVP